MDMGNLGESAIPWMDDEVTKASTSSPVELEENTVGPLVIIIISAVISITLLFVMAVFIDCRHQKLDKNKKVTRRVLKISIPGFGRSSTVVRDDQESFADKMQTEDVTPTSTAVIV